MPETLSWLAGRHARRTRFVRDTLSPGARSDAGRSADSPETMFYRCRGIEIPPNK